jgi:hypothetical protein
VLPVTVLKPLLQSRKKLKPGDKEYEKIKNSIEEFLGSLTRWWSTRYDDYRWPPALERCHCDGLHGSALRRGGHRQDREKALNIALNKDHRLMGDSLLEIF